MQDALQKVSRNKTTLVIAHKLATIRHADNIVVVSAGRVAEQGTHEELMAKDGRYAALVCAQDLGMAEMTAEDGCEYLKEDKEDVSAALISRDSTADTQRFGQSLQPDGSTLITAPSDKSLFSCLLTLLKEQRDLYGHFMLAVPAAAIAGGAFPAQALLFSNLIGVFTLPIHEGQSKANTYALILFAVALANAMAYFVLGYVCNRVCRRTAHSSPLTAC